MADIIKILPDYVANQIAAGEVVQRPASAVKELMENAIDAQATQIKLLVRDAGKSLVQVIDNGIGMTPNDARVAFQKHATSKINSADDLFSLKTKGFRGEALPSIAAIAQMELTTRTSDMEVGIELVLQESKIVSEREVVAPLGTSVSMKNLFFNIPARRNFLKSNSVELRHILDEFYRIALCHPQLHFQFYNEGNQEFNLTAGSLKERIVRLFGSKINQRLLPVNEVTDVVNISGFICRPTGKKSKNNQYFMVNNRFVKNSYLRHAVLSAYEGLLKEGELPEFFINLTLDPKSIDINIHPTKTEVKFEDEHTIYAFLRSAVKHSLGQYSVQGSIDFSMEDQFIVPYHYKDKEATPPTISVDTSYNPFENTTPSYKAYPSKVNSIKNTPQAWESLYKGIPSKINTITQNEQSFLSFDIPEVSSNAIIYFQRKYLIVNKGEKLLVLHANRAHQQIIYERYERYIQNDKRASQQLLFPIETDCTPLEVARIGIFSDILEQMGFTFNTNNGVLTIDGIPTTIAQEQALAVFKDLVEGDAPYMEEGLLKDILLKKIAKNLSITVGQSLSKEQQEELVSDFFTLSNQEYSPFNKKIKVELSTTDLDKLF